MGPTGRAGCGTKSLLFFSRDKNAEDEVERNATSVHVLKSRATGWTGKVCELFYDSDSHTLWDKDECFNTRGVEFR
jgi:hypothetical protein